MSSTFEDIWFKTSDGLKLHALAVGAARLDRLPVVCLPGISRTVEDFRTLLSAFAKDRHALALDSRGRGLSEWDRNSKNYSVPVELNDLMTFLREVGIERAIFVGTSRGGILTMALASLVPNMIAGAVLNDIGPVTDLSGLLRIKSYVGKLERPSSWQHAVEILKRVMGSQFPGFSPQDWGAYARRTWDENFRPCSDPAISAAFEGIDTTISLPTMWHQYGVLAAAPLLILRGEYSDLLSLETVKEMERRGKNVQAIQVSGQGHAPAIEHDEVVASLIAFANRCDTV